MGGLVRRIATLPGRAVRGVWHFANPQLKAGRIPYARTVLVLQLIGALVFVGYTLAKKQIQVPLLSSEPYHVEVVLSDAAGLDPSKEPAAGVAGAASGKVVEVDYEGGQAVATLGLDPDLEGKVFADATAELRPINVLQVLIVNIDPGDPSTGRLPEGQRITADRTTDFVHIDELTEMLDADTQAQLQVLISEGATALKGREPELRRILAELGELTETATPLADALDDRRRLLRDLVDNLDVVFTTLGERGNRLGQTINAGSRTLAVTAEREQELAAALRELAPTVGEAERALAAGRALATPLNSALDQLLPATPSLQPAADETLELIPQANDFLGLAERVVADGARPVRLFERGTRGLAGRVERDLIPAIDKFGETIGALDKYKRGIAQTADLWSGAFSANANNGAYSQVYFGNAEIAPEGLGLAPAATRSAGDDASRLTMLVAEALERTCRQINPAACGLRFALPGLPAEPVLPPEEGGAEGATADAGEEG